MSNDFDKKLIEQFYKGENDFWSHFNSPSGGGGAGGFIQARPMCSSFSFFNPLPHPNSPAACYLTPEKIQKSALLKSSAETVLNWDEVKADFERWEGRYAHMYLDTKGLVTVGVGKMLPSVAAAQGLDFVRRVDGVTASAKEIETDFNEVKKQPAAKIASSYEKHTKLDLKDEAIDDLLKTTVDGFENSLENYYKDYKTYPTIVKRALLDMAYNLGMGTGATKKHKATGLHQFTTLKAAVESSDWKKASENCHRKGPSEARNNWTRDLFLEASKTN
jgi:GH24 family phage-related lysozyme (muramidase)